MRGGEEKLPNLVLKFRLVKARQVVGSRGWTCNRHMETPSNKEMEGEAEWRVKRIVGRHAFHPRQVRQMKSTGRII